MSIGPLAITTVFNSLANAFTIAPLIAKLSLEITSLAATSTPLATESFSVSRLIKFVIALISDMLPLINARG